MRKIINNKVFRALAAVFTVIASMEIKSASFLLLYQPKAPKSLTK